MGKFVNGAMSPHKIYEYFATGRGTGTLDDAQAATRDEWQLEDERAHLISKQGELIRGGWQGSASEGAFGAAKPLADSALHGATTLSRAEDLLDRQSGSFHRAANDVQPVPPEPPGMDLNDTMLPFTDYEAQVREYQAGAQHNIGVYGRYDGASEYNQTNMPEEYSTVNHSGGSISVVSPDSGDYFEVPEHEDPRRGGESGPPGGPGGSPGGAPVGGPPGSGPVPNPWPSQQTSPNDYVPPAAHGPGYPPTTFQPTPQPTPGPGQAGFVPGPFAGGPGGGGPGGSRGGAGPRGGAYGGAGGNPGPGAGGRGGVPGAGPGTGAIAAEEAAARRAAAAAASRGGAPGGMGGAPVGGGRGKGDEDDEHQRKVLLEIDAEGVFGSDMLTAPQVIGDDDYEDD